VRADVLVIGAGGAGLTAALEAANLGVRVAVIEKAAAPGGNTLLAGGGLDAAGTTWQKNSGVDYPPELLAQEVYDYGGGRGLRPLIGLVASRSAAALDFLHSAGLTFRLPDPMRRPLLHQADRGSTGAEAISALLSEVRKKKATVDLNTTATELVQDARGAITGVRATDAAGKPVFYSARATIIATGGSFKNDFVRLWSAGSGEGLPCFQSPRSTVWPP